MLESLIHHYEVTLAAPECSPGSEWYRAVINLADDIGEALPYLNADLGGYDYYHSGQILLWANGGKRYAFRPREIAIAPVSGSAEACELAEAVVARVNRVWNRRKEIKPAFEGRKQLPNVPDLYKLLPGTNCRKCGFPTCMAFAAALRADSTKSALCPHLAEQDYVRLLSR